MKVFQILRGFSGPGRSSSGTASGETGWDADKMGICMGLLELLMGLRDSGAGWECERSGSRRKLKKSEAIGDVETDVGWVATFIE